MSDRPPPPSPPAPEAQEPAIQGEEGPRHMIVAPDPRRPESSWSLEILMARVRQLRQMCLVDLVRGCVLRKRRKS